MFYPELSPNRYIQIAYNQNLGSLTLVSHNNYFAELKQSEVVTMMLNTKRWEANQLMEVLSFNGNIFPKDGRIP